MQEGMLCAIYVMLPYKLHHLPLYHSIITHHLRLTFALEIAFHS